MHPFIHPLRQAAMTLPMAEEGVACEGTALEKRTFKVHRKAFVFLGAADVMMKPGPSAPAAREWAQRQPRFCKVGANGWMTVKAGADIPPDTLILWIAESHGLIWDSPGGARKTARRKNPPR
ncbi:MAG: hypothetical protein GMKNLPBB_02561 [Myxococcota bacterium]|nr:hypothetical protein [Myxococcota bacterium]